jgi:lipid A 3-O-deacylase
MVPMSFADARETGLTWGRARMRCAATGALLLFLGIIGADPAAAQIISFGSPGDPPRIALGGGVFNVLVDTKKASSTSTGMILSEYRFGDVWWIIAPFLGVQGTARGSFYGYFGISFDVHLPYNFIFTPSAAAGFFEPGQGLDLGSKCEFRTGGELAYRFADDRRLGVSFYHMSNAGIGRENPGQEMLEGVLTAPFR